MKRLLTLFALALALALLSGAGAPAVGAPHLESHLIFEPARVNFGAVPVDDPDCTYVDEFRGCATVTVTIRNSGTESFGVAGYSVCATFARDGSSCEGGDWGGMAGLPSSTCLEDPSHAVLEPGDSCRVVLVAIPGSEGLTKGYLVVWSTDTQRIAAALPVKVRGV